MEAKARSRAIVHRIEPMIGPAAAVLLGFAAGFFCFAMPRALIGRVLDPAMIGGRLPLALIVALVMGLATWALFRALDRRSGAGRGMLAIATRHAAPVLRRADAHPDAPPRRPIFAGSDLGTPLDLIDPLPMAYPAPMPVPEIPEAEVHHAAEIAPEPVPPPPFERASSPPRPIPRAVAAAPAIEAPADTATPLPAMMARLEAGLARKALVLAGAEANVTALRREIRPVGGSLRDAVAELQARTAARR